MIGKLRSKYSQSVITSLKKRTWFVFAFGFEILLLVFQSLFNVNFDPVRYISTPTEVYLFYLGRNLIFRLMKDTSSIKSLYNLVTRNQWGGWINWLRSSSADFLVCRCSLIYVIQRWREKVLKSFNLFKVMRWNKTERQSDVDEPVRHFSLLRGVWMDSDWTRHFKLRWQICIFFSHCI